MGSYDKKVIISGNVIEVYEYKNSILYGYKDKKKAAGGRSSVAEDKDKEVNREKVLSRARKDLRRIINSNIEKYSKFLTLTFRDNVTDLDFANYEFNKFIKRLNYHYKIKVKYSVVIEFQKRGAIHYHCLLYNLTQKIDIGKMEDIWGNGFVKVNAINNVDNVGAYVCKYMTKTEDSRLEGRKMYFNSRNLNKPKEIKDNELIEVLTGSLSNQSPKYENVFSNEYNDINYKQYIISEM